MPIRRGSCLAVTSNTVLTIPFSHLLGRGVRLETHEAIALARELLAHPWGMPTPENILSKNYPISRALFNYTNGEPTGVVKEYLDFVRGTEGQKIVTEVGYVPLQTSGGDTAGGSNTGQ